MFKNTLNNSTELKKSQLGFIVTVSIHVILKCFREIKR